MKCPNPKCEKEWLFDGDNVSFKTRDGSELGVIRHSAVFKKIEIHYCSCGLCVAVVIEDDLGCWVHSLPEWAEFAKNHWQDIPEEHTCLV